MSVEDRVKEFLATRKTLFLATTNANGIPTASYAPFIMCNGCLYVYTSALSRHTADMKETNRASAMVLESASSTDNLFARKRITFSCGVGVIARDRRRWEEIMDLFGNTFGVAFAEIRPLRDFTLFQLVPVEAVYVEGFGRAYRLDCDLKNPVHLRGTGPGAEAHPPTIEGS